MLNTRGIATALVVLAVLVPTSSIVAQEPVAADSLPQDADSVAAEVVRTDSIPEAISSGRSETDEAIRNRLQAIFDRVESLSRVEVEVDAGIVRLSGRVAQESVSDRAVALAGEQEGALWVVDDIRLDVSLGGQLQPTWDRLRDLAWTFIARAPLLVVALLIVALFGFLGVRLAAWGGPSWLHDRNPFLRNIVGRALQATAVAAGILIGLDLLEATTLVGAVAGTAGLAGLALGFAFKDLVENYLAGVLLALRRPFDKNDHVVVGSEHEGKVIRLTPREAILMTLDGNHVRVPNALIFRSAITNYTRNPLRRFSFDAGIGPVDDLALAREVGIKVLKEMTGVQNDPPPEVLVTALGDSSVTVRFMGWVDQREADFRRVRSEAIRLVKIGLEDSGVSLPSPEYVVRLARSPGDLTDASVHGSDQPGIPRATKTAESEQADVSPNLSVEWQIEADRRDSDEEDLLEASDGV